MLAFGEVQTGLLQNSTAVPASRAAELVDLVLGEPVRRFERPMAYAVSPDRPEGVDCRLPTASGARVHAVGTLLTHAAVVGGHILQGSAYALKLWMQPEAVNIPFVGTFLRDGVIHPNDVMTGAATAMLDALSKVATALKPLRAK